MAVAGRHNSAMKWTPGDTVMYRYIRQWNSHGLPPEVRGVRPTRVVEANDNYVLLWQPAGVGVLSGWHPDGKSPRDVSLERRFEPGWSTVPEVWEGSSVLYLMRPEKWSSVHWFFDEEGRFRNWYVNVETPGEPTSQSWDTDDLELDVVIQPDRTWHFKDEDEFEAACKAGAINPKAADRAQREAEEMAAAAEKGTGPFSGIWTDFTPGKDWRRPVLLPGSGKLGF